MKRPRDRTVLWTDAGIVFEFTTRLADRPFLSSAIVRVPETFEEALRDARRSQVTAS